MRTFGVVSDAVLLAENPSFEKMTKDLSIQQVLAECSIEAIDVAVLPRSVRLDEPSVDIPS